MFEIVLIKIALIFHSTNNDNLGVGALSVAGLHILRQQSAKRKMSVHITFLTGDDSRPSYVFGSDVSVRIIRPLRRPLDFLFEIRKYDVVVDIGGGDSFADIYGPRRIVQMYLMKFLTHLARRPLIVAPQTIGPFRYRWSRLLARQTLRLSTIVSTRDELSSAQISELGFIGPIIEASDVALKLPFISDPNSLVKEKLKIGINVSGLLWRGGYSKRNMFGLRFDYPDFVRKLLSYFLETHKDCEIHLIPHVISWQRTSLEDDYSACLELSEHFSSITVAPAFNNPVEAKNYIAGMDFFIGARMHACIAAFSTGVPVVPLAYSRKFSGLFGSLGYNETIDCTAVTSDEALTLIRSAFARRKDILRKQETAFNVGISKLERYENALGDFLASLDKQI